MTQAGFKKLSDALGKHNEPGRFLSYVFLWPLLIACIPLVSIMAADFLTNRYDRTLKLEMRPSAEVVRRMELLRSAKADLIKPPSRAQGTENEDQGKAETPPTSSELLKKFDEHLAKIDEVRNASNEASAKPGFLGVAYFAAAVLLFATLAVNVITAQLQLVRRSFGNKAKRMGRKLLLCGIPLKLIVLGLTVFVLPVATALLSTKFLSSVDLPGNLETGLLTYTSGTWNAWLPCLWLGLVTSCTFVTGIGTFLYARNFPPLRLVEKLRLKSGLDIDAMWTDYREDNKCCFERIYNNKKWRDEKKMDKLRERFRPSTASPGLHPADALDAVRQITLPLVLVMVSALVVLQLALSLLVVEPVPATVWNQTQWQTDIDDATTGWLLLVGAGFSLTLFALYSIPYQRIRLYAAAAESLKKDPEPATTGPGWRGSVRAYRQLTNELVNFEVTPANPRTAEQGAARPDPDTVFDTVLASHLGANRERLGIIVESDSLGGGFHDLLETTLSKELFKWFAILTPALTGTLLTFLA